MKRFGIILLLAAMLSGVSCTRRAEGVIRPVAMVQEMLADTSRYYSRQVLAAGMHNDHGTIAVVGVPEEVILVTEGLLTCDVHDNISGRHAADGLPDFSGETVAQVLDIAGAPYDAYCASGTDGAAGTIDLNETFRTLHVRNFLHAIDTTSLISQVDESSAVFKQRAKMVVFASSYSDRARYDIDTLCRRLGVDIPVITPVKAVSDYVRHNIGSESHLLVWADDAKIGNRVWQGRQEGVTYHPYACGLDTPAASDSLVRASFLHLLDGYLDSGSEAKLAGLVVDNLCLPFDSLREVIEGILSTDDDNLLIYRNILNPDFECFSVAEAISDVCYGGLRTANAFTHRIAYPDLRSFFTSTSAEQIVELRDRYFSESLMDFMEEYAPKTFSLYVR